VNSFAHLLPPPLLLPPALWGRAGVGGRGRAAALTVLHPSHPAPPPALPQGGEGEMLRVGAA
jgi:hypothetical protein